MSNILSLHGNSIVLLVGASGSGKSTLAQKLVEDGEMYWYSAAIYEADEYFIRPDSLYDFDQKLLGRAHKWCQDSLECSLKNHKEYCEKYPDESFKPIHRIISNTNTTIKEMKPYWLLAQKYDHKVQIIRTSTPWSSDPEECFKRNVHRVPEDAIRSQLSRLSNLKVPDGIYEANSLLEKYI